jgi:hypothetical protein
MLKNLHVRKIIVRSRKSPRLKQDGVLTGFYWTYIYVWHARGMFCRAEGAQKSYIIHIYKP